MTYSQLNETNDVNKNHETVDQVINKLRLSSADNTKDSDENKVNVRIKTHLP